MGLLLRSLQNDFFRLISPLFFGPSMEPSKLVSAITCFESYESKWPVWCRMSDRGSTLFERSILGSLVEAHGLRPGTDLVEEVESIRLQSLTYYKCYADWQDEFIRADYVHTTTNGTFVAVWERELFVDIAGGARRGMAISGLPCNPVDWVKCITEEDFQRFVKMKDAYVLRTAKFPSPGLTHLQVSAVLETHSLLFPAHHIYTTLCYWFTESVFEVLVDVNDNVNDKKVEIKNKNHAASQLGQWILGVFNATAHTGVTQKAASASMPDDAATAVSYEQYLVNIQAQLIRKYERRKTLPKSVLEQLPEVERESIKRHGWNVAQFLSIVQAMPTHEGLLDASKTRAAQVRTQLEEIQSGRDEAAAAARREYEAQRRASIDIAIAERRAEWEKEEEEEEEQRKAIEELRNKNEELRKEEEELRKEMKKKDEEQRKEEEEMQKKIEELRKENKELRKDEQQ